MHLEATAVLFALGASPTVTPPAIQPSQNAPIIQQTTRLALVRALPGNGFIRTRGAATAGFALGPTPGSAQDEHPAHIFGVYRPGH
jgi:hypothetical protein